MAVTKQTYTATGTWTPSQLATQFRSAFIDAGLMTEWYDSFVNSSVENRVLEVVYDNSKTYGKVYYWFMFTTAGAFVNTAINWSVASHAPSGVQYLDYYSVATNSTSNHRSILSLSTATDASIIRYTSAIDADCSWFVLKNGSSTQAFFVPSAGFGPSAFVDQNKAAFNGLLATAVSLNYGQSSYVAFRHYGCHTRRTYLGASALNQNFNLSSYTNDIWLHRYWSAGNTSNSTANVYGGGDTYVGTFLPTAHANTNTALASNHAPVFTQPTVSPYMQAMPSDFGVTAYYSSNAMVVGDKLIVSAGTEEWEMLAIGSNTTSDASRTLFLARVV